MYKRQIIYLALARYGFRSVKTPDQLEAPIESALKTDGMKYLFIDEVQNVEGFEEVVNEFRAEGGFPIFITGSNSYLLSGELATKLTGRYVEFEVQTLSFKAVSYTHLDVYKRQSPLPLSSTLLELSASFVQSQPSSGRLLTSDDCVDHVGGLVALLSHSEQHVGIHREVDADHVIVVEALVQQDGGDTRILVCLLYTSRCV